jgi:sortase A
VPTRSTRASADAVELASVGGELGMSWRHSRHSLARLSAPRRALVVLGVFAVLGGLFLAGRIALFYTRTAVVGGGKVRAVVAAGVAKPWPSGVLALLRIPSLGLAAPVEQGTNDSVLDVAVGHLATSVMPGQAGTSILAAHNVSWFSGLGGVHRGDLVEVDTPTAQQVYKVAWHKVVKVGATVLNTHSPSIVLEACWPLNALYLTPHRYLVGATLVSSVKIDRTPAIPTQQRFTPVGIVKSIADENLSLVANDLPMGSFAITGSPAPSFTASSSPYSLASAEVTWLIALLHASHAGGVNELTALTHQPASAVRPLADGYSGFATLANLTENVIGTRAIAGSATVTLDTAQGPVTVIEEFKVTGRSVELDGLHLS